MKVELLSYSDSCGGAARATYRLHRALLASGTNSTIIVNHKATDDCTVSRIGYLSRYCSKMSVAFDMLLLKKCLNLDGATGLLPTFLYRRLNDSPSEIIHLNWVSCGMLSLFDIASIKKPIVWTVHDMWPFCGIEFYSDSTQWQKTENIVHEKNAGKWHRMSDFLLYCKIKSWKNKITIVAPSKWMADCVTKSKLMGEWPVKVIPNALDTNAWTPIDKGISRDILRLPKDKKIVLFGAVGGGIDPRKGFDLLISALSFLGGNDKNIHLAIFGQSQPENPPYIGIKVSYLGHMNDDNSLRLLYSSADVMVVPSRLEAFGQTASESLSCGTPVVAFSGTGVEDIVDHKITGYLAVPYDVSDLAAGVEWVLGREDELNAKCRQEAVKKFSYKAVAAQYISIYNELL